MISQACSGIKLVLLNYVTVSKVYKVISGFKLLGANTINISPVCPYIAECFHSIMKGREFHPDLVMQVYAWRVYGSLCLASV